MDHNGLTSNQRIHDALTINCVGNRPAHSHIVHRVFAMPSHGVEI